MAKPAKHVDVEITTKVINAITKSVLENYEGIETQRGKFMNAARRYREQITDIYENAASKGIPQRVMKLQIEIERLRLRLNGKIADLDDEHRKILTKVAKARGNKAQLAFILDPPATKPALHVPQPSEISAKGESNGKARAEGAEAA